MNSFLWVLQGLLAIHTAIGAVWKLSNSEQTVQSLSAIPHGAWLSLSVLEIVGAVCLILPAFSKSVASVAPIAATFIAAEMILFCILNLTSGSTNSGEITYWIVVAAVCAFVAYGRFVLTPL